MHGIVKNSSTTTKLRVVFDASAHSESGASLNDQLLSLYPHLTRVVNRFRTHSIGKSSDMSKMFREVGLQPSERDFGSHQLRFDELTTVLMEVEGVINSQLDSTPDDGIPALTPGHFLVGQPLLAPPTKAIQGKPSLLKRWNLVQHITDEIWIR